MSTDGDEGASPTSLRAIQQVAWQQWPHSHRHTCALGIWKFLEPQGRPHGSPDAYWLSGSGPQARVSWEGVWEQHSGLLFGKRCLARAVETQALCPKHTHTHTRVCTRAPAHMCLHTRAHVCTCRRDPGSGKPLGRENTTPPAVCDGSQAVSPNQSPRQVSREETWCPRSRRSPHRVPEPAGVSGRQSRDSGPELGASAGAGRGGQCPPASREAQGHPSSACGERTPPPNTS